MEEAARTASGSINLLMQQPYNGQQSQQQKYHSLSHIPLVPSHTGSRNLPQTIPSAGLPQPNFNITADKISKTIEVFTWRSKTSLPILRVDRFSIMPSGAPLNSDSVFTFEIAPTNQANKMEKISKTALLLGQFARERPQVSGYEVAARIETLQFRLEDIEMLSFPQAIHLFKELLVGYEVLIDIFGFFQPQQKMVIVNASNQWKVWISSDFACNEAQPAELTVREFILSLMKMVQAHSLTTSHSKQFFLFIEEFLYSKHCSFIKTFEKINEFAKVNKILQVKRVALPMSHLARNKAAEKRLETSICNKQGFQARKNTCPTKPLQGESPIRSRPMFPVSKATPLQKPGSSYRKNYCQPVKCTTRWQFSSVEIPKAVLSHHKEASQLVKPRPSCSVAYDKLGSARKQDYSVQSINLNSLEFPADHRHRTLNNCSPPAKMTGLFRNTGSPSVEFPKIKSAEKFPMKLNIFSPSKDVFGQPEKSITFSRNGSHRNDDEQQACVPLKKGNALFPPTSSPEIMTCTSPNNSSSTKEVRNSTEMPDMCSYSRLKEKDLKARNNYSVINNPYKKEVKPENEEENHHHKTLAISHQFHNRASRKILKNEEPKPDQWTSSITGLFEEAKSIKCLKGSIIKHSDRDDEPFEKEHLKNVKLDLLDKYGRKVEHIGEDDSPGAKRKYTEIIESMQLIEEDLEEMKSYLETDRKGSDISKSAVSIHKPEQSKNQKKLKFTPVKSKAAGKLPDTPQDTGNILDSFNFQTEMYVINPGK